jgi:hypothetical protein
MKRLFLVCFLLLSGLPASNSYAKELPVLDLLAFPEDGCFDVKEGGQCNWIYIDEAAYVEEWKDGESKILRFGNLDWYFGEVSNGVRHGQGTYTSDDGSEYVGQWKNDKYHGQGIYTIGSGQFKGDEFVGEWKDGQFHGQGIYTFADGAKHIGEFKDGKIHGQGILTFPDGTKYVGGIKDSNKHGQGIYIFGSRAHSGDIYVGEWKDDNRWQGTEYDKDGNVTATYSEGVKTE